MHGTGELPRRMKACTTDDGPKTKTAENQGPRGEVIVSVSGAERRVAEFQCKKRKAKAKKSERQM